MEKFKAYLPIVLAVASTLMVVGILLIYAFVDLPDGRASQMSNTATMVVTQWVAVMGYFFGSSQGSADKTKLLNEKKEDK